MKRLKKLTVFTFAIFFIAPQSCGLTGNKATKTGSVLHIIKTEKAYTAEIQGDSLKRMVSLTKYLQPFNVEWKYATPDNFTKVVLYNNPDAFVRLPAARALQSIQNELKQKNIGLKFFDAYRPYSVTVKMWEVVPDERYAANPARGSGHNRGVAVDVTLINLTTGKELLMPTAFDNFTEKAHHNYMQLPSEAITNRQLLKSIMEKYGFVALETEWWHYYLPNPTQYSLMDLSFDQLRKLVL